MRGGTIGVPGRYRRWRICRSDCATVDACVHRKQIGKTLLSSEPELEDDIFNGIIVIVDLELVEDVRVEREPVRAISGLEQRIDPEDERHMSAVIRTAVTLERI